MRQLKVWLNKTNYKTNKCLKRYSRYRNDLYIKENIIWYIMDDGVRPVVSFKTVVTIVIESHQQMGHIGPYKLKE